MCVPNEISTKCLVSANINFVFKNEASICPDYRDCDFHLVSTMNYKKREVCR